MHKDAETISGRYRDGKLTAHEKNFITEITTALTQEKNKVMNGLRGEIKRKQSMAAYIGQIDALKKQVEELEGESKAAGQGGLRHYATNA
ncbi:ricin-type beta-trefoil lectin domain protein [Ceratobasidium sp. AG-Ba]|nr:ricin-type beta-trefoil lectin domain protein [Ceratobasidium sp. AG-Ba]